MWTLRRRTFALCAAAAAMLGLLAIAATVTATISRNQVSAVTDRYTPLRADAERLLATLVGQETGIRGYALNGTLADLEPYHAGLADERALTAAMAAHLAGLPQIEAQLAEVVAAADTWRALVAEPVIAAVASGGRTAAQALLNDEARVRFDTLRGRVAALQNAIVELRDRAADQARTSATAVVLLLLVAAVVVLVTGVALLTLLQRLVTGPVTDLAAQVRLVAGGDYARPINTRASARELASLARDVNGMRERIVADLAEVVAARERVEEANAALEAQTAELAGVNAALAAQAAALAEANTALENQAAELERSNRDLEQFAYVASHDLQEPLRKVASFCQLLQRRYAGQLDERADQYIAFAVTGAQRMQRLINDLLAFSRIGRTTAEFTEVDLDDVVANAADAYSGRGDTKITWTDLPVVRGEESLLDTLFTNLIGNAVKFRRPDVPPRVHISAQREGDAWEIAVADNGIGVEADYAEKVFVIFQRLHPREAYAGTGIGLAIAKKIVEHHGGRIWVDATTTEGTTIRFTVPAIEEQHQ